MTNGEVCGCNADADALGDGDEGGAVKEGVSGCKADENFCGWGPDKPEALAEESSEQGAAAETGSKNLLSSEWSLGSFL
jgi:hypothetical protein